MIYFYSYNTQTGKIKKNGHIFNDFIPYTETNEKIVTGKKALADKQYHNLETNILEDRPILDIDDITLIVDQEYNPSNIPSGTIVNVDGEDVGVVDNMGLILVFTVAKTYKLHLKPSFPYFEKTITIEVITEWLK